MSDAREQRFGLINGVACYLWWGLVPLYFHAVSSVPALGVVAHRVVWSIVFLLLIVAAQARWSELRTVMRSRRMWGLLAIGSVLIATNWLVFIYAVAEREVLQSSLGYFINPLVSVMLGMLFLRERLRIGQWAGVMLATVGVLYLTLRGGVFPWISLTLAFSFGFYGLLRKLVAVGPVVGLLVETTVLLPVAIGVLGWTDAAGWDRMTPGMYGLLSLAGIITALPLLWFAAAARRLRLSTIGFLQYIAPSMQFAVAVLVFKEPLKTDMLIAFGFIWTALVIYSLDSLRAHRTPVTVVEMAE